MNGGQELWDNKKSQKPVKTELEAAATWLRVPCSRESERMKRGQSSSVLAMENVVSFMRTLIAE